MSIISSRLSEQIRKRNNKEIQKLGMKIARQESDKLHDKQFKKNFKRFDYGDFMDACLKCFEEGYKFRRGK